MSDLLILILLLAMVGRSAAWMVNAAVGLSKVLGWSDFIISFGLIAVLSVLPEAVISVLAALRGVPSLGLGTLLGSNIADLALVLGAVAVFAGKNLKVERDFLKKDYLFLAFLLLPLVLGFGGHFSRLDGLILIGGGIFFFYLIFSEMPRRKRPLNHVEKISVLKGTAILLASIALMGISAHFIVASAAKIADGFAITPALVGLVVIALGTTLPELLFSLRAVKKAHPTLALGDILGIVITDVTLVLGAIALIHPFSFNPRLIILTGVFMLLAALLALSLFRSGRALTREEGVLLLAFYIAFIVVEFVLRDWTPPLIQ